MTQKMGIIWYYDNGEKNILYTYEKGVLNGPTKIFSKRRRTS